MKSFYLFCCMIFVGGTSQAQQVEQIAAKPADTTAFFPRSFSTPLTLSTKPVVLPASYYADNLSFFCDQEWKFEKATKIPFRFRLGSVEQVDYLEGKPNAVKKD